MNRRPPHAAPADVAPADVAPDVPLRQVTELPILGVPVRFESNSEDALSLVEEAFGAWRSLAAFPELIAATSARVRLIVRDGDEGGAENAPVRYEFPSPDRFELHTPGSFGLVDGARREAVACLTPALLADRAHARYVVVEGMTLTLVSARNRFPVHAAAIARRDTALLLAGPPGTGKSTLAYQAHRAGLRVLADDAAYVQVEPELRLWGMPGRVDLVAAACAHFPELAGRTASLRVNGEDKIAVELAAVGPPGGAAPPVASRVGVCLLERRGRDGARLTRAGAREVRAALKAGLGISRFRFGKDLDRALASLVPRGGWRLSLSDDPADAMPLLDQVLDELDQSAAESPR